MLVARRAIQSLFAVPEDSLYHIESDLCHFYGVVYLDTRKVSNIILFMLEDNSHTYYWP